MEHAEHRTPETPETPEIIERARAGDAEAFRELVESHSPKIFRLVYRITGDEASAEDAVQETFLRAYRSLGRFDARSGFGTWLHRIAVNTALELVRKQQRHRSRHEEMPAGEERPLPSSDPGPDRLALGGEVERAVRSALAGLSPMERTAFILRHFEDRSIAEICDQLGLGVSAGKQAVFRAVKKLRRVLEPLVQRQEVRP
ncbi:MAG TPA: sigma-70 family RNA polymerase sigma factor [Thermoanaerobaculia bacterium]|jgi:RNA polymerase sigma-70 factor (ECF subfamily)|nr:sigma-70 family RNA polymerase sigma factor [Thermoanaerobaculia bacterium]